MTICRALILVLGLNIAKQISRMSMTAIFQQIHIVENNVIKGARFIVNLPMSKHKNYLLIIGLK